MKSIISHDRDESNDRQRHVSIDVYSVDKNVTSYYSRSIEWFQFGGAVPIGSVFFFFFVFWIFKVENFDLSMNETFFQT